MSNEYLNRDRVKYEMIIIAMQSVPERHEKSEEDDLMTLDECILAYKEATQEYHDLQNMLAVAFFTLSDNLARYAKFSHIDIDDAVQEGVMICFEKIDRFNPEIGKAFNYMTTCILNHFRQLYRTARNYNELKKKYRDFLQTQVEQAMKKSREKSKLSNQRFGDMG
jgi:DNA-directed RNA polymerase specialized sigma24 family protein